VLPNVGIIGTLVAGLRARLLLPELLSVCGITGSNLTSGLEAEE
jgi:hypothetical protein